MNSHLVHQNLSVQTPKRQKKTLKKSHETSADTQKNYEYTETTHEKTKTQTNRSTHNNDNLMRAKVSNGTRKGDVIILNGTQPVCRTVKYGSSQSLFCTSFGF